MAAIAGAGLLAMGIAAPAAAAPAPAAAGGAQALQAVVDSYLPALTNPGGSLPGVNDWDCVPSPEHPNPVVLVHGTFANQQTEWAKLAPALQDAGYCVYALDYGVNPGTPFPLSIIGGLTRIQDSAQELSAFVDEVLAATGAQKVDIVGHSQGTLMPNYYVKFLGGAEHVDKYVSLAPLWKGTQTGGPLAVGQGDAPAGPLVQAAEDLMNTYCGSCTQMSAGSPFIEKMNAGGTYAPGVQYTNIMTEYDGTVIPWQAGYVEGPNATNIVVQDGCAQDHSDHSTLVVSARAIALVLGALDPANPVPVPCEPITPFGG